MPRGNAPKYTLSLASIFFFIGLALFFDLFKVFLLFVDLIPLVGPGVGELGTYVVSFLEVTIVFGGLYMAGGYKGQSAPVNALFTLGAVCIDLAPLLDHLPATTAAVVTIIIRSRAHDVLEHKKHAKHDAKATQREQEQASKKQAANAAAQNARNMGPQGMPASRSAF